MFTDTSTPINNSARQPNNVEVGAWTAFTPTLSCGSGRLGGGNVVTGYYKYLASKTVLYSFRVKLGASGAGTCTGALILSVPIAAAVGNGTDDYIGSGRDMVAGKMLQTRVPDGSATISVSNYDNTTVIANNGDVRITGMYQSQ